MATKNKKTSKQVNKLAFNKKNMLALADRIYTEKAGVVTMLKLCSGDLVGDKVGGRQTHCAVGEAYHIFVNPSLAKINKKESPTDEAIEELISTAQLRKDSDVNRSKLRTALKNAVQENDADDEEDYLTRSQDVATIFRKEVAPLLK